MSMDHFHEEVAVKHSNVMDRIAYMFSRVILVISGLFAMMNLSAVMGQNGFNAMALIMALISGGIAVAIFLFHDRLLTEYEYTFTNGTLDFAQVFNNKKRKSLGSLKVNNVDAFGKVASGSFHRYVSMQGVQQSRWFLNRGADLYYFYFQKDSNKKLIVFEPTEDMVSDIKHYLPYGAYQEN